MPSADADARIDEVLARPPRPPTDPARFSSDSEVGPGIYPGGPPMRPAPGAAPSAPAARAALALVAEPAALAWYDRDDVVAAVPDHGVRAAVAALHGTVAESAITAVLVLPQPIAFGEPIGAGRIAGLDAAGHHVVNQRYAAEHPALLSGAVAHEVLAAHPAANNAEEVLLHGVLAMVHLQLLVRRPALADLGTELSRRVNSLAITLFNSRPPSSPRLRFRAPDGPGTIPGGAPGMQSPDFWSIPFTSAEGSGIAPTSVRAVLAGLVDTPVPDPFTYERASIDWLDDHLTTAWLAPADRLRAGVALGLLDLADLVGLGLDP